jgi:hypothetical protein
VLKKFGSYKKLHYFCGVKEQIMQNSTIQKKMKFFEKKVLENFVE